MKSGYLLPLCVVLLTMTAVGAVVFLWLYGIVHALMWILE